MQTLDLAEIIPGLPSCVIAGFDPAIHLVSLRARFLLCHPRAFYFFMSSPGLKSIVGENECKSLASA